MATKLVQGKFNEAGFHRHVWVARPDYGVLLADVLKSEYWANVSSSLKPGAKIEVQPEGLTYYAELIVLDAGPNWANVKVTQFVDLVEEQAPREQAPIRMGSTVGAYQVRRSGAWFQVVRGDKEVIKTGFRSISDAEKWATDNLGVKA